MATGTFERDFEKHITDYLTREEGYRLLQSHDYNKKNCLFPEALWAFLEKTQPEKLEALEAQYGAQTREKVIANIAQNIKSNGLLHVLRKGITDRAQKLQLCYFAPANDKNEDHARLFSGNRFGVVRQLYFSDDATQSIDLVLTLNGLPLFTAELKNALTGQYLEEAIRQYQKDRDPAQPLLSPRRCLAHFAVSTEKVAVATTLAGARTRFLPFNQGFENPVNPAGFKTAYLWEDVWTKASVADLIENFLHIQKETETFFDEKSGKLRSRETETAIFPRYHQRRAVYRLLDALRTDGVGQNYLIQHSAGSGKSNTIAWLAHRLAGFFRSAADPQRLFDSILVVTDRRVLDRQLQQTIRQFAKVEGVVVAIDEKCTSQQLREAIEAGRSIIITTLQKFPVIADEIRRIPNRNYAVIIDEAHSSQTGEASRKMRKALSDIAAQEQDEKTLDDLVLEEIEKTGRQPNLSMFAFTATPKPKTVELFGSKDAERLGAFDLYSMEQAIREGFILDVLKNYVPWKRYYTLSQRPENEGDKEYDKRKAVRLLASYVDLQDVAFDTKSRIMLEHFAAVTQKEINGKARAMLVTRSRLHAVRYKRKFDAIMAEMRLPYRALVAFSGTVTDPDTGEDYTESSLNGLAGSMGIPEALKTPQYRLLIVAEKFQTGFDEPLLHTLFVDKKLGGVATVQTLSRLNRTHAEKSSTLVIDFVNDPELVREDFQEYYGSLFMAEEDQTEPNELYDLLQAIGEYRLFSAEDVNELGEIVFRTGNNKELIQPILGRSVALYEQMSEDEQQEFRSVAKDYCRMYRFLSLIITFRDVDLEKHYVFLSHLLRLLPVAPSELPIEVLSQVELSSYRLQKLGDATLMLEANDAPLYGMQRGAGGGKSEEELAFLSEIIKRLNETFGLNLGETDRADLEAVQQRITTDPELAIYFHGGNSRENVRDKFNEKLNEALLGFINGKLDLYNKLSEDQVNVQMKKLWFDALWQQAKGGMWGGV